MTKPEEDAMEAAIRSGTPVWQYIESLPENRHKPALRTLEKWVRKGRWEYGVSLRTGWFTD